MNGATDLSCGGGGGQVADYQIRQRHRNRTGAAERVIATADLRRSRRRYTRTDIVGAGLNIHRNRVTGSRSIGPA